MRRQFSGVVKYCWPSIWLSPKTSHSRKSTRRRPSGCIAPGPVTRPWALMTRQLANCGGTLMSRDLLDEGLGIERLEKARAFEIGAHDACDVRARLRIGSLLARRNRGSRWAAAARCPGDVHLQLPPMAGDARERQNDCRKMPKSNASSSSSPDLLAHHLARIEIDRIDFAPLVVSVGR